MTTPTPKERTMKSKTDAASDADLNGVRVDGTIVAWANAFPRDYMTPAWLASARPTFDPTVSR